MSEQSETGGRRGDRARHPERRRSFLASVPRNVVMLGLVSLLTDTATELVVPLLPIFLTVTLGAGPLALGWIEGAADAVASVLKLLSGRWADRMGRNRPLVLAGYTISSLVRPLIAIAGAAWHVLAVRTADRIGKGLRSSPRDALIAASVEPGARGAAFGLHRAMDHTGAVLGPLLACAFLTWWSRDLRLLFWLTAFPGALAVITLLTGVREKSASRAIAAAPQEPPASWAPPGKLARLLVPIGVFTLGNASDLFLLLKASESRSPLMSLPLLWMGLHVVKATSSLLAGNLADRVGRRKVIGAGWVIYAGIYTAFAFAQSRTAVWILFLIYGLYHGLCEGAEKALVTDLVPAARRGTAFGWYHLVSGFGALVASVLFGALWQGVGSATAFLTSAALALLAVLLLAMLAPRTPRSKRPTAAGESEGVD